MSTEILRRLHRKINDVFINPTANNIKDDYDDNDDSKGRRGWYWNRNVPLLATTVVHASLYLAAVFFLGSDNRASAKLPPGFPGPRFIGQILVSPSYYISIWFWYLWYESGFRHKPKTEVAFLYLGFIGLSLAWSPVVFGLGSAKVGLFISLANLVIFFRISYQLKEYLSKIGVLGFLFSCGPGSYYLCNLNFLLIDQ